MALRLTAAALAALCASSMAAGPCSVSIYHPHVRFSTGLMSKIHSQALEQQDLIDFFSFSPERNQNRSRVSFVHLSGMLFVSICKDRSDSLLRPIAFHQTHLAFGLLTFPFSFPSSHRIFFRRTWTTFVCLKCAAPSAPFPHALRVLRATKCKCNAAEPHPPHQSYILLHTSVIATRGEQAICAESQTRFSSPFFFFAGSLKS